MPAATLAPGGGPRRRARPGERHATAAARILEELVERQTDARRFVVAGRFEDVKAEQAPSPLDQTLGSITAGPSDQASRLRFGSTRSSESRVIGITLGKLAGIHKGAPPAPPRVTKSRLPAPREIFQFVGAEGSWSLACSSLLQSRLNAWLRFRNS
jgi:hypothetical protein